MSSRGQPQYRYVPVELSHIERAGGSGEAGLSSSDNLHKWQAFGLNTSSMRGLSQAAQPTQSAESAGRPVHHHLVVEEVAEDSEEKDGGAVKGKDEEQVKQKNMEGGSVSSIHRMLWELSSRVGQTARESKHLAFARRGPQSKQKNSGKNATAARDNDGGGGVTTTAAAAAAVVGKRLRGCGEGMENEGASKRKATSGNDTASTNVEGTTAHKQEEKGQKSRRKPSARNSHAVTASNQAIKMPQRRGLFTMPPEPLPSSRQAELVAFKELDNSTSLFEDVQETLKDPDRIQAPTLFVAFILHGGETGFSISAATHGKVHFLRGINPEVSHLKAQLFVLRWKDDVFVLPASVALVFLVRVTEELLGVEIVTFNAPSLLLILLSYKQGNLFTSCISDIRLMSWMLQPAAGADAFTDYDVLLHACQNQLGFATGFGSMENWTVKEMVCHRVYYMSPLYRLLYGQLGTQGLLPAFLKQERRISLLCALMKLNGFSVKLSEVEGFKARCTARLEEIRLAAQKLVPSMPDFNMQNLDECRVAIYEVLQLGTYLTHTRGDGTDGCSLTITKSGKLSTSEETLKMLAPHHELPRLLIAYRKTAKLLQTYAVGMMETAFPLTGDDSEFADRRIGETGGKADATQIKWVKLHPNFVQEGTDTGRLSCVEPNLQNLPRARVISDDDNSEPYEAEMATFRRCFAVPTGFTLLSVDYEQIELRVLAHLSADTALVEAMTNATDIHRKIAETIFRKSPATSEERTLAKRAVFGMLYGAGPRTLATQMGGSVEQAVHVMSLFKTSYPQIDRYHRRVIEQCRADGFVRTMSGRIRFLPDINDRVMAKRSYAERQAFNSVIQGSAADVMKLAMLAVERDVLQSRSRDVRLLAQVHDEIVLSLPTHKLQEVVPLVTRSMTHAVSLLVPLPVTVKIGQSLGELEDWTVDHELGIR
ncbi:mitochondrial DNA polymerase I protein A [Trypanosoma rangeli SC58]|uniref:DNA-directed DNA polymerase n=1 Tax=Trypanosoma rangeli SC58 TaxID=429131 RepID=A0A061J0A5_TRYRA|nr:mitochondrial DNA polymerase I protein A [Trypanosoma rangeli SC58]